MPTSEEFEAGFVALLGDLVKSREHRERSRLQERLKGALRQANQQIRAVQPLSITIGDEFQGLYGTVAAAAEASLFVRLALIEESDVRFGIGWGPLTRFSKQRTPFEQDGPAWWAAREAIDRAVKLVAQRESPRGVRTVFVSAASENVGPEGSLRTPMSAPRRMMVSMYQGRCVAIGKAPSTPSSSAGMSLCPR